MRVKGLLLDLDGTLYVGDEPVPGAREAVARLQEAGLKLRYVTNTTRVGRGEVCRRLREMGFPAQEGQIIAPAVAAATRLRGRRVHALVAEALLEDLKGVITDDASPEFVLVGDLGEGFDYARLNSAFQHLMAGARLVALQKNRYWQTPNRLALDAGPFVAALEYASRQTAEIVGKPEKAFFEAALQGLGLETSEVAMVGDDAEADVAGAQTIGLLGVQVKTGKYKAEVEGEPDLIVESVAELPEVLGL